MKYIILGSVILILILISYVFIFKDEIERQLILRKYEIKEFNRKSPWDEGRDEERRDVSKLVYLGKIDNYKVYYVDFFHYL